MTSRSGVQVRGAAPPQPLPAQGPPPVAGGAVLAVPRAQPGWDGEPGTKGLCPGCRLGPAAALLLGDSLVRAFFSERGSSRCSTLPFSSLGDWAAGQGQHVSGPRAGRGVCRHACPGGHVLFLPAGVLPRRGAAPSQPLGPERPGPAPAAAPAQPAPGVTPSPVSALPAPSGSPGPRAALPAPAASPGSAQLAPAVTSGPKTALPAPAVTSGPGSALPAPAAASSPR